MARLSDEKAFRMVAGLLKRLKALKDEVAPGMGSVGHYENDDFGFMALCFVSKQLDHVENLLKVFPSHDSILIARSMVEGLGWLYWAAKDPQPRAARWRDFSVIEGFRSLKFRELIGDYPTPEMLEQLDEALRERGGPFLTKNQKAEIERGAATRADPYHKNWANGITVRGLFKELDSEDLWTGFYAPFSQWPHWCPTSFADALEQTEIGFRYRPMMDARTQGSVLATAFRCLLESSTLLAEHFGKQFAERLNEIEDDFVEWHRRELGQDGLLNESPS